MRLLRRSGSEPNGGCSNNTLPIDIESLERRMATIVPARFRCAADVSPVSMGSAKLRYGPDGRVAWDEIWTHFCDLALAGGPPHRGTLLEPASPQEIADRATQCDEVTAEIARGIGLVTQLPAMPGSDGWIAVQCHDAAMAGWMRRAITCENVLARQSSELLLLPTGPSFRVEKEIKNVITAAAKTFHDWMDHIALRQKQSIAKLLPSQAGREIEALTTFEITRREADEILSVLEAPLASLGLPTDRTSSAWLGIACDCERMAGQVVLGLVADGILARREGATALVPLHPSFSADCGHVVTSLTSSVTLWRRKQQRGRG